MRPPTGGGPLRSESVGHYAGMRTLSVLAGSCNQHHIVIRLANEAVIGESLEPSPFASPRRHLCPGPGEMLVQDRERDVTEQRREYSPLRGAGVCVPLHAILTENARFEKRLNQSQNASVSDSLSHPT